MERTLASIVCTNTPNRRASSCLVIHTVGEDLSGMEIALDCSNGSSSRTAEKLFTKLGVKVHMRIACPQLIYGCPFIGFTSSKSDLAVSSTHLLRLTLSFPPAICKPYFKVNSLQMRVLRRRSCQMCIRDRSNICWVSNARLPTSSKNNVPPSASLKSVSYTHLDVYKRQK